MKKLKIAFIGLKGIPANWGGIEKYVEEIGKRLSERHHEVTIFCSQWYCKEYKYSTYKGMIIKRVPTIHLQLTDAISNAALSTISILLGKYDVIHFHAGVSYFFVPLLRYVGNNVVVTAHGMESLWDNPKYNATAKIVAKKAISIGIKGANCVTTIADHAQRKIFEQFGVNAQLTPSGIDKTPSLTPKIITDKYGLKGNDYFLFLGRIDPIKRVDWVVELSNVLIRNNIKMVVAGGAQDSSSSIYLQKIKGQTPEDQCIFTGPVTGDEKTELLSNCRAFVSASENEGLPISLLEALSFAKCCIVSDIPAHLEVIEEGITGILFKQNEKADLFRKAEYLMSLNNKSLQEIGTTGKIRIEQSYNWDKTTDRFEEIYLRLLDK